MYLSLFFLRTKTVPSMRCWGSPMHLPCKAGPSQKAVKPFKTMSANWSWWQEALRLKLRGRHTPVFKCVLKQLYVDQYRCILRALKDPSKVGRPQQHGQEHSLHHWAQSSRPRKGRGAIVIFICKILKLNSKDDHTAVL